MVKKGRHRAALFLCAGRDGFWFNNFHGDNKERFPFVYQIIQKTIHFSAKHIFNRTKDRKHTGKSQHCWHEVQGLVHFISLFLKTESKNRILYNLIQNLTLKAWWKQVISILIYDQRERTHTHKMLASNYLQTVQQMALFINFKEFLKQNILQM